LGKGLFLRPRGGRPALYAARRFEAGEPVLLFERVVWCGGPGAETVEHPCGRSCSDTVLALATRASHPNCRIAAELMALIARRDIARGERITIAAKPRGAPDQSPEIGQRTPMASSSGRQMR
jgi:hypothetical protein